MIFIYVQIKEKQISLQSFELNWWKYIVQKLSPDFYFTRCGGLNDKKHLTRIFEDFSSFSCLNFSFSSI